MAHDLEDLEPKDAGDSSPTGQQQVVGMERSEVEEALGHGPGQHQGQTGAGK
jgi:hypothetical protein